jgi:hypothetical protein
MNHEMLQLEKLSEALQANIRQLMQEDTLTIIDRDLLKQQCVVLYEKIVSLSTRETIAQPVVTEKTPVVEPQPIPEPEPIIPEPVAPVAEAPQPPQVDLFKQPIFEQSITLNDFAEVNKEPETPVAPTETEIRNTTIDQIIEQQHQEPETPPVKTTPDPELTLHEKIAHSMEPKGNLIEKLSASIPSLKNAINVNLKIALVGQLFNDNTVEYVKAIDRLNSCENIHEAMRYFNELKHQYAWDGENHNVKELEQLLNKRYN